MIVAAAFFLSGVGHGPGRNVRLAHGQETEQEPEPAEVDARSLEPKPTPPPPVMTDTPSPSSIGDEVVGVAGTSLGKALVITRSGRVFALADGERAWSRVDAGGLSARLSQVREFAGEIWGAGDEPPAFRFVGTTWSASPVNRKGAVRLASCAAPGFVVGRRVFVRDRGKWKELRKLPGKEPVAAFCAVDLIRSAVLLTDGSVQVLEGGTWRPIILSGRGTATRDGRITWLGGDLVPVVAAESGRIYRLDGTKPVALGLDARLTGLRPSLAARAGKRLWLVGAGTGPTGEAPVIVRLDGKKLVLVEELPAEVGTREWIGAIANDAGIQLLAARDGTLVRRVEGGGWVVETLPTSAPTPSGVRKLDNPPAHVGDTRH